MNWNYISKYQGILGFLFFIGMIIIAILSTI